MKSKILMGSLLLLGSFLHAQNECKNSNLKDIFNKEKNSFKYSVYKEENSSKKFKEINPSIESGFTHNLIKPSKYIDPITAKYINHAQKINFLSHKLNISKKEANSFLMKKEELEQLKELPKKDNKCSNTYLKQSPETYKEAKNISNKLNWESVNKEPEI